MQQYQKQTKVKPPTKTPSNTTKRNPKNEVLMQNDILRRMQQCGGGVVKNSIHQVHTTSYRDYTTPQRRCTKNGPNEKKKRRKNSRGQKSITRCFARSIYEKVAWWHWVIPMLKVARVDDETFYNPHAPRDAIRRGSTGVKSRLARANQPPRVVVMVAPNATCVPILVLSCLGIALAVTVFTYSASSVGALKGPAGPRRPRLREPPETRAGEGPLQCPSQGACQ